MNTAPSRVADLLAECNAQGVRLLVADHGGLIIDAPRVTLTSDLVSRLRNAKGELLATMQPTQDFGVALAQKAEPAPISVPTTTNTVCRCGASTWCDVPIHDGQSVRRDCGRCGRFIAFPVWYGALQNEKY